MHPIRYYNNILATSAKKEKKKEKKEKKSYSLCFVLGKRSKFQVCFLIISHVKSLSLSLSLSIYIYIFQDNIFISFF